MKDKKLIAFLLLFALVAALVASRGDQTVRASAAAAERDAEVEAALFERAEFFGVQAIVPVPTSEARRRLAEVAQRFPDDAAIALKLAALDEKLGNIEQARAGMLRFVELEKNGLAALESLAAFYARRAAFAEEAAARERMIAAAPRDARAEIVRELIEMARLHRLEKYQRSDFFRQVIAADPAAFGVVKEFIDHLIEQGERADALAAIRQYRDAIPAERDYFLEKEIQMLSALGRRKEAETVYLAAFDPFWNDDQSRGLYDFLSRNDRLRAYGRELKEAFRRNPASLDTAVRLFHYLHHDYEYNNASASDIFERLERARAARGVKWTADELTTIAQLLIEDGDVDRASRFLYTLHQRGGLVPGSEPRARVLYSLFTLVANAGESRTPFTAGDLRFYQDVARSDPHPGMLGGVLSLVLSDTDPQGELETEERFANAHFNRAAAWRIFTTYKAENQTSPQLAKMYLDLIRMYTNAGEARIAADLLAEFEKRHGDTPAYAEVAFRLADAFVARGNSQEERAMYQRIMDFAGRRRPAGRQLLPTSGAGGEDLTAAAPATPNYPEIENPDVSIRPQARLVAIRRTAAGEKTGEQDLTYAAALNRSVASLARENRQADILSLYAAESKKYPDEQGLYEQWLQWLGQTNLVDEQLRVYREAIQRFPTNLWNDRLARWYLRRDRKEEFDRYSQDLLARLDDEEVQNYLSKFAAAGVNANASAFDAKLSLSLHKIAHRRFPHNLNFVEGLLNYYANRKDWEPWRQLMAEYYFESRPIRDRFLEHLSARNRLRESAATARGRDSLPYKLFLADAAVWLSNYEDAVEAYRELNRLYPNTPEFAERLVAFTRSFGQKEIASLNESARVQNALADANPASEEYRTTAGELYAELGDYKRAAAQWDQLLKLGAGDKEIYLNAATVYWDYYQYDDAMRVLGAMRAQMKNDSLYAYQMAAILESKHQTREAIAEYVKDLDTKSDNYWRAGRRLAVLWKREKATPPMIRAAVTQRLARAANRDGLALGFVNLLQEVGQEKNASAFLKREMMGSRSQNFLSRARDFFREHEDDAGQVAALRRLTGAAKNARFAISYQLQLADLAAQKGRKEEAALLVTQLVARFPNNYGVLSEAADFYWRLGKRDRAVMLLTRAARRSRGQFRYIFSRRLAARQIDRGQLADAEKVLGALYREMPRNLDLFTELSRLYVRTARVDALRDRYRETIRAIKDADMNRAETNAMIDQLRESVIESFTALKDYKSALEQHIEIINRSPEDPDKIDAAVKYATRYGGAEMLIDYYKRTSAQSFKDYRWNLVLSRLYEAGGDAKTAAAQMNQAIANQPESAALLLELAELHLKAKEWNAAAGALQRVLKMTNDDPAYLRKLAEIYDQAGRRDDAAAVRAKLPVEAPRNKSVAELFAAAITARRENRAKSIALFRSAWDLFSQDVYKHPLRAYELNAYAEALRGEESLDQILRRLWELRKRVEADAAIQDNLQAGKARALLETIDSALPESVGRLTADFATGEEQAAIARSLRAWVNETGAGKDQTLAALFNLAARAGLRDVSEEILTARKEAGFAIANDPATYHQQLMALVNYHSERGAYAQVVTLLSQEMTRDKNRSKFSYYPLIAEYARLAGDRESELRALRDAYSARTGAMVANAEPMFDRYFEILLDAGEPGRAELQQCIDRPHPNRLQLINFLYRRNEIALLRKAIERTPLSAAWKSARQGELSLATSDFSRDSEAFFLAPLGLRSIGEMVAAKPDPQQQFIGDAWYGLAAIYGRWLAMAEKGGQTSQMFSAAFLPAGLENRPRDPNAQAVLGKWYLEQGMYERAIEHLSLSLEMQPDESQMLIDLGSAYFKRGQRALALAQWNRLIERKDPNPFFYLETLVDHGLAAEARATLKPLILKRLNTEELKPLFPLLAKSFADAKGVVSPAAEAERAALLREFVEAARKNLWLPEMIIRENLVRRESMAPFYQALIARTAAVSREAYDFDFAQQLRERAGWTAEEVEEALDHRAQQPKRPEAPRLTWQREYLQFLLTVRRDAESLALVDAIEQELKGLYARPDWLRMTRLQLQLRGGQTEAAMAGFRRLALIEADPRLAQVIAPNMDRVNAILAMLRGEKRNAEASMLLRAAYERMLALDQLQYGPFSGLSRLAFAAGDAEQGIKLLRLMIALGTKESEKAKADLAALDWIKARTVPADRVQKPAAVNQIGEREALRLAAELAAEFARYEAAIEWRTQFAKLAPEDTANRMELARTQAAAGDQAAAIDGLSSLMIDPDLPRQARWTALWTGAGIAGKTDSLWQAMLARAKAAGRDVEMIAAVESMARFAVKPDPQALEPLRRIGSASSAVLGAILLKQAGQDREALDLLLTARIHPNDAVMLLPFAATEEEPRWMLVRLYARSGLPLAALRLAAADDRLKGKPPGRIEDLVTETEAASPPRAGLLPLAHSIAARQLQLRIEVLSLLSESAAQIADWNRAIEFERARFDLLTDAKAREESKARMTSLLAKQKAQSPAPRQAFSVSSADL
jgi:tetratricopeptide (TPR) repeat protein